MDVHTKKQRSYNMSRIRNRDTKPEIMFRKFIWAKGIRGYRTNAKLKGRPDLYFLAKKVAVFIDGCFWHQCPDCFKAPKTNKKFWREKIHQNINRDLKTDISLKKQGINPIRFWEHQVKKEPEECYKELLQRIS
ncbi:very short patch repair endonuclease [Candidatus Peregrinibacteria bacterium]|nr:very short patch repair endonuclease [Candidatus Peregrinibacteria bacterium]